MPTPLLSTATRYFLAVARTGSISEAAGLVHVAPSAVSRQMAKLEEALGCALFERQARGMVLTEAGERLAAWARASLQDTERVAEDLRGLVGQHAARIHVACTEGFTAGFMPQAMAAFRAAHPQASLFLRVGAPHEVSRWLLRGEVDAGLKFASVADKGLQVEYSGDSPIMAVMAPTHALARKKRVRLADVVSHPLALPEPGTTVRQALDLACGLLGLSYQAAYSGNLATLLALVAQGEAITFASYLAVAHAARARQLVALPVQQAEFESRRVLLLAPQGREPGAAAQAFIAQLRRALAASATR
jgi:DNA-binding transcriptional LysR family regulator